MESTAVGIKSIHESGYAHRDIKIENVIIGTDNNYKLCDFGSCTNKEVDFSKISSSNYSDYDD
jgi:serine/threonine protein kinase